MRWEGAIEGARKDWAGYCLADGRRAMIWVMSRDNSRPRRESAAPEDAVDVRDKSEPAECVDHFAPPKDPCECWCMHCRRVFMSDKIWFQRVINDPGGFEGFWKCPTPNCDGAGFTFDIHPTDPDHPANEGWSYDDGDEEDYYEDDFGDGTASEEWDPDEAKYHALDGAFGDEGDDDIEGEEWKYGLQPGERPPEPEWAERARREHEEEEARYDQPDERPRVVDWRDREDRWDMPAFNDDDIPF